jgi:hypothetical protein
VAEAGTPFKVLSGLVEEFGTDRVIDTPISEPGFMGMAVGAAMTGSRPVVDLMFGDFIFLVMDQLCNQAAKTHYMSGGKLNVPLVLRTNLGATRRSAAQHSQSLQALVAHIPGLKVALPSSAYEAKGLMKTAIRDNNPVVIFEDKLMYQDKAPVPEEEYLIPFGEGECEARRLRHHADRDVLDGAGGRRRRRKCWPRTASRRGHRPAHHRAAGRGNAPRHRAQDLPRHRHRRGAPELRRDGGDRERGSTRRRSIISTRRSAHGGHGCAGAVSAGAGRPDRADAGGAWSRMRASFAPGS